jgi:DNA segregation ATPase FtsK/SpoIIIE, S-DNA-T family
LPVGRREDGLPWLIRLHGTHVLVAGATGAGKASLLWGLVRAVFPLMRVGLVRVLAADPKLMELAYGRIIFDTHGQYAADPASVAAMLDQAVADMQARAARFAGHQRDHTPTAEHPFTVVLVDEVAFLTAYQPDRKLRERIMNALATLTTQGRAVGYSVVAALQDPRKDVLAIRNLFPDPDRHAAGRARAGGHGIGRRRPGPRRGLRADLRRPGHRRRGRVRPPRSRPRPGTVRAGWVTDADIRAMTSACLNDGAPRALEAVPVRVI